ncbi:MAG: response regulator [Gammaproteobacteria bacterium]|nr:response regulator [Gammaproteobacteria bacterium]MDH5777196.1 response regulator [Gammaproteobacteria bacterium]
MAIPIIICDDSSMARKQMWRALPTDWDFEVTFAANGKEAIEAINMGKAHIMFLDLTMPVMDGFEVLETLHKEQSSVKVIVVSGDVQPESYSRVMALGAVEFIKKPFDAMSIIDILDPLIPKEAANSELAIPAQVVNVKVETNDIYREVANIAMGRAADLLAQYLNAFIVMPIPHVNMMEYNELQMAIEHTIAADNTFAVCQGFISQEVSGEALAIFTGTDFNDLAELLNFDGEITESAKIELSMDITSILVGAILKSLKEQVDIDFCQGYPIVLGHRTASIGLIANKEKSWKETLAVEMFFTVENKKIYCDFIIVFNTGSIDSLKERIDFLAE